MFDWNNLGQYKSSGRFPDGYPSNIRTFFSPVDKLHELILSLFSSTQHSFVGNFYGFDDQNVNNLLLSLVQNSNIYFQLNLDSTQAGGKTEKELLSYWPSSNFGTSIAIGQSAKHAIS